MSAIIKNPTCPNCGADNDEISYNYHSLSKAALDHVTKDDECIFVSPGDVYDDENFQFEDIECSACGKSWVDEKEFAKAVFASRALPEHLRSMTLDQVENGYRNGTISEADHDHYLYHWRNESGRFSRLAEGYEADECPICGEEFPEPQPREGIDFMP